MASCPASPTSAHPPAVVAFSAARAALHRRARPVLLWPGVRAAESRTWGRQRQRVAMAILCTVGAAIVAATACTLTR